MINNHDGPGVSELSERASDRLRGKLAERRIRQAEVMFATGWSKTTAYRKINGKTPLDIDDLGILWQAFGISPVYLLTGKVDNRPFPGGGGDHVSGRSSVQSRQEARRVLRLVASNGQCRIDAQS